MRFLVLILGVFLIQEPVYPPESQPLTPPETIFKILGFPVVEDEPAEGITENDAIEITLMVVLAVGVNSAVCQEGTNRINNTIFNSNQGHINVKLVKCYQSTYVSSGNSGSDLGRMCNSIPDGNMDEVHALRNEYAADIMMLVGKSCDSCGIAYLNATSTSACGYVCDSCMSNSSFEHECGHILNMQHDRPNSSNGASTILTNFGLCFGNGFRDVMTYPSPCGGTRAPYYSNPDVLMSGVPTGNTQNNNALALRLKAPIVANFRSSLATNHLR